MKNKEKKIYVIGHKNPDTDSICSAIAYSEIKNRISNSSNYQPMRAGEINAETRFVLEHFGVEVPKYLEDVGTQVSDMDIDPVPGISRDITLTQVWNLMSERGVATQPVVENNKIVGVITKGDIASTLMGMDSNYFLSSAAPTFDDIARTVEGKVVIGDGKRRFTQGKILVGAAEAAKMQEAIAPHDLILLADRGENQIAALESGADCLILCFGADPQDDVKELACKKNAVIIDTNLDTFTVSRKVNKSAPVSSCMITDGIITFREDDYTENIKDIMLKTRHRAYPVVDDKNNYVGTITRRDLIDIHRKQVILVDHNETSQAVDNIDQAEILEIVDHHRIGTLQTVQPITFINQPVGCTATILYQMFVEKGIEISKAIAGLLCSAILSDTLMFRSPTCTIQDKMAAGALALIADINIEEYASAMFEAGSDLRNRSAGDIFYQDYKKFTFAGTSFGVGQISSMSNDELDEIKKRLLPLLTSECGKNGVSMVFMVLTNIRNSESELLFAGNGSEELILQAFDNAEKTDAGYLIKGLLSRKKQLIPAFMKVLDQ